MNGNTTHSIGQKLSVLSGLKVGYHTLLQPWCAQGWEYRRCKNQGDYPCLRGYLLEGYELSLHCVSLLERPELRAEPSTPCTAGF